MAFPREETGPGRDRPPDTVLARKLSFQAVLGGGSGLRVHGRRRACQPWCAAPFAHSGLPSPGEGGQRCLRRPRLRKVYIWRFVSSLIAPGPVRRVIKHPRKEGRGVPTKRPNKRTFLPPWAPEGFF